MGLPNDKVATLSESTAKELLELCKGFDGVKINLNPDNSEIQIDFYKGMDCNAGPTMVFHSEVMIHEGEIDESSYIAHQDAVEAVKAFNESECIDMYLNKRAELDQ